MATRESRCPVCDEVIEGGDTSCKRCGFKFIGETQMFQPVVVAKPDTEVQVSEVPALEVVKGPYAGESFTLSDGKCTIGRDPNCDIFLSNMTVSRHHATIVIEKGKAQITDEGSLNGTWVNGVVVDQSEVVPGDHVQIGTFEMVFKMQQE